MRYLFYTLLVILGAMACKNATPTETIKAVLPTAPFTVTDLTRDSIEVGALTRYFEYQKLDHLSSNPSLVFVMHGSNGNVADTRRYANYEFEKSAYASGDYLVVYPEGYDKHWNDCRMTASYAANQEDVDDISFFSSMIDYFSDNYNINRQAVFATGISNGGHMCYKLGYEMPEHFKAIAPIVANMPRAANNDCTPKDLPISILIVNGTEDPINPNEGGWVVLGQDSSRGAVMSTNESVAYWRKVNNCTGAEQVTQYDDMILSDSCVVVHHRYTCVTDGIKTELMQVQNGGHTVPVLDSVDIPAGMKRFVGNRNRDISAPAIILEFFSSHL